MQEQQLYIPGAHAEDKRLRSLIDRYRSQAGNLPYVRQILLEGDDEELRLCTVIDGPREDDGLRDTVYGIEEGVLADYPDAPIGFYVVNRTLNPSRDDVAELPASVQMVYTR